MADFYLITTELDSLHVYAPRACRVLRWLRNNGRDDLALVSVDPPIPKEVYGDVHGVSELMLGARFQGQTVRTVEADPVYVYVCLLTFDRGSIPDDVDMNFRVIDWGAVYRTEAAAFEHLRVGKDQAWPGPQF